MNPKNCKVNFRCEKAWDGLEETDTPDVRYCDQCSREVHFCDSIDALKQANEDEQCVAVQLTPELPEAEEFIMMGDIDYRAYQDHVPPITEEPVEKIPDDPNAPFEMPEWAKSIAEDSFRRPPNDPLDGLLDLPPNLDKDDKGDK